VSLPERVPLILFALVDAGAVHGLMPVMERLRAHSGMGLAILARGYAARALQGSPLAPHLVEDDGRTIERIVREAAPAVVVLDRSSNPLLPQHSVVAACRACGIPTVAFIDHWINPLLSFVQNGRVVPGRLPDYAAVIDEQVQRAFIGAGFAEDRIWITGHPALDETAGVGAAPRAAIRQCTRQELDLPDDAIVVLFASEHIEDQERALGRDPLAVWGYTEKTVLGCVLDAVQEVSRRATQPLRLVVKPHPNERVEPLCALVEGHGLATAVTVVADHPRISLLAAADVVMGMTSMLLFEADALGLPVVSVTPGAERAKEGLTPVPAHATRVLDAARLGEVLLTVIQRKDAGRAALAPRRRVSAAEALTGKLIELASVTALAISGVRQVKEEGV
jgi:hypothetical protein